MATRAYFLVVLTAVSAFGMDSDRPAYDIPLPANTGEPPGGWLIVQHTTERFSEGTHVSPHQVLDYMLNTPPELIETKFRFLVPRLIRLNDDHPHKQLFLEAAQRLGLIPTDGTIDEIDAPLAQEIEQNPTADGEESTSTPNFDELMRRIKAIREESQSTRIRQEAQPTQREDVRQSSTPSQAAESEIELCDSRQATTGCGCCALI